MDEKKNLKDLYDADRLYAVARMYYEEGKGQSAIAEAFKVSRPTVSRMLTHARTSGMVQIRIIHPDAEGRSDLAERLRSALHLEEVYLARGMQPSTMGQGMLPPVQRAVDAMRLTSGDALVISSGMALYGIAQMRLSRMDGVKLVPSVGGVSEPEAWHQTNEIVRMLSQNTGSTHTPLFASAIPSKSIYQALQKDESFAEVRRLWRSAKGAIVGIGSPTTGRTSLSSAIPKDSLPESIGDVCLHFFNRDGRELTFPGSDRIVRIPTEDLSTIPYSTAVAVGEEKCWSIVTAASMKFFRRLVTDEATATHILRALRV
ncbi:sugar-binding domain-containing protein [Rothia sp. HC945]|uniref:sugar-binding transcriptional regulator n=1 Tax=Rothia sp. HC945 TaxID=3171170 RepID=UPI00264B2FA0|nr:transcriptional regulator [Kocuria sp.]MDN5617532.1 transcriptional regulator [Kocuria sp.]MDN5653821.1 transcriptional regulator [Kocuria sp.]